MGFGDFVKSLVGFSPFGMLFNGVKRVFGKNGVSSGLSDILDEHGSSYLNSVSGAHLTGSQVEANEMQMQNVEDQFQRQVTGMQAAGLNPALMYQNGASGSAPSAPANSANASLSDLMQVAMLPMQMKMMNQQIRAEQLENKKREVDLKFLTQEKTTALAFTSQQIENLKDALRNNEVERALKRSGISLNEANEALTIQNAIATAIDNETRDALNNAMLSYRAAETAYTEQKTEESKKQMDLMEAQVNELYQRAILEGAQAGVYDQQTLNMLQEYDILQYDKERKAFEVSKQNADRNWRIFNNVVGAITGVAGAAGSLMIGGSMLGRAMTPVQQGLRSGLILPRGTSAFEMNYGLY